jgi:hypothetical protein
MYAHGVTHIQEASFLKEFHWASLTVDEGHRLKNSKSRLYLALCELNADCRLLLSGTPLQNNLDELFMLIHFIEPDKFADLAEFQVRAVFVLICWVSSSTCCPERAAFVWTTPTRRSMGCPSTASSCFSRSF